MVSGELPAARAAAELAITQSAVSRHVKTLEEHLDCQLFERHGSRLVLTDAGRRQEAARLLAALAGLPAEQREIIVLREEENLTLEQIAAIQGVGRETVKSRLRYALAKLREVLGDGA